MLQSHIKIVNFWPDGDLKEKSRRKKMPKKEQEVQKMYDEIKISNSTTTGSLTVC